MRLLIDLTYYSWSAGCDNRNTSLYACLTVYMRVLMAGY